MQIGNVKLKSNVIMAPIAGMTDYPYRKIVMDHGAGMVVGELLSTNAIVRDSAKTLKMLPMDDEPHPVAAQIFGADPEVMSEAAKIVERTACDIIDLNFGCPVKKVTKCGAGSALLKDVVLAEKIAKAVIDAVNKPVTVKIRIGWNKSSINAVEMALMLESVGAKAIAVHARTASQMYTGEADWSVVKDVAAAVSIPVIGNGDIATPEIAAMRLRDSGCAGVMIGRGALGNPWIFGQINDLLTKGVYNIPTKKEIANVIVNHLNTMVIHYGERIGVRKMRTALGYYTKGLPGGAKFRDAVNKSTERDKMLELINDFYLKPVVTT